MIYTTIIERTLSLIDILISLDNVILLQLHTIALKTVKTIGSQFHTKLSSYNGRKMKYTKAKNAPPPSMRI